MPINPTFAPCTTETLNELRDFTDAFLHSVLNMRVLRDNCIGVESVPLRAIPSDPPCIGIGPTVDKRMIISVPGEGDKFFYYWSPGDDCAATYDREPFSLFHIFDQRVWNFFKSRVSYRINDNFRQIVHNIHCQHSKKESSEIPMLVDYYSKFTKPIPRLYQTFDCFKIVPKTQKPRCYTCDGSSETKTERHTGVDDWAITWQMRFYTGYGPCDRYESDIVETIFNYLQQQYEINTDENFQISPDSENCINITHVNYLLCVIDIQKKLNFLLKKYCDQDNHYDKLSFYDQNKIVLMSNCSIAYAKGYKKSIRYGISAKFVPVPPPPEIEQPLSSFESTKSLRTITNPESVGMRNVMTQSWLPPQTPPYVVNPPQSWVNISPDAMARGYCTPIAAKQDNPEKISAVLSGLKFPALCERNDAWERNVLLLHRVEMELMRAVFNPEEANRFNLNKCRFSVKSTDQQYRNYEASQLYNNPLPNNAQIDITCGNVADQYADATLKYLLQCFGLDSSLFLIGYVTYSCSRNPNQLDQVMRTAYEVAEKFGISTDEASLFNISPLAKSGNFAEGMQPHIALGTIIFRGFENAEYYKVARFNFSDGKAAFLPIASVSVVGQYFHKPLFLPPRKHHLLNEDVLLYGGKNHVLITEHLELAMGLQHDDAVFLSWWGGRTTLDSVDFSPLAKKRVHYLFFSQSANHPEVGLSTAFKVCRKIKDLDGIPVIVHMEQTSNSVKLHGEYDDEHFEELARKLRYDGKMYDFFDPPYECENKGEELIEGLITTPNFIVLLGEPKAGKTFVGLALALSVAYKTPVHNGWHPTGDKNTKVLYFHGEMSEFQISERVEILKRAMKIDKHRTGDFEAFNVQRWNAKNNQGSMAFDMTDSDCQKFVKDCVPKKSEKYSTMVVFDNYNCLMGKSMNADRFLHAYELIIDLQRKGCCVVLACHTNSDGNIASSSQLLRKADGVIRVSKVNVCEQKINLEFAEALGKRAVKETVHGIAERLRAENVRKQTKLSMYINYEDFRCVNEFSLRPMKIVLMTEPEPSLTCEPIDFEQLINEAEKRYSANNYHEEILDTPPKDNKDFHKLGSDETRRWLAKAWHDSQRKNGRDPSLVELNKYFGWSKGRLEYLGKSVLTEEYGRPLTLADIKRIYEDRKENFPNEFDDEQ